MNSHPTSGPSAILAFCHLRKTGGVAFNGVLRQRHGGAHLDAIVRYQPGTRRNQPFYTLADLKRDRWIYPRLKSISGHYLSPSVDYGETGRRFRWVTILRDPCRRYLSHYAHHVEKMEVAEDFESWMLREQHHDDQVKTIAGSADLDRAKELLRNRFVVGLLEEYEQSMDLFQRALPEFGLNLGPVPRVNVAKGKIDVRALANQFDAEIRRNNQLDQELYEFARDVLWPEQRKALTRTTVSGAAAINRQLSAPAWARLTWARIKRNLLYKPSVQLSQR